MPTRPRVLSFLSQWGGNPPSQPQAQQQQQQQQQTQTASPVDLDPSATAAFETPLAYDSQPPAAPHRASEDRASPALERPRSRVSSMIFTYQPPTMEIAQDTPPELQPIFTYLNSHSNKLYQEGYFLKLHDLDSRGRPSVDRVWNECFAQLVGTVLSLWDAAQLDLAGEDGEVIPTFINLTDASIKMIESLPMNGTYGQSLQNVLSISTAANNRYLLHFNSLHSLTQWTAGIRLAMFEHSTLQESYTGSILAGKGKYLNGIRAIMERSRFPTEDWARVRFGAGTPWRRCWCVITPPGEKEYQKAQKLQKKRSAYDRSTPIVKGDIKFYETRKVTKKTKPIATITEAFSAYAIYPQSKPLIEQSTLVKVEGLITIHGKPESTTEGFVFVMPELHQAVTGFETMLRWLLPVFDTFALYGRPHRLIADVLDVRSLMFAMPTQRRYGYLELIDVAGLIHTEGSSKWNEKEWRKQMKTLTSKRISAAPASPTRASFGMHPRGTQSNANLPTSTSRSSLNLPTRRAVAFGDEGVPKSSPSSRHGSPGPTDSAIFPPPARTDSAPPAISGYRVPPHKRAVSDVQRYNSRDSRQSFDLSEDVAPPPPAHSVNNSRTTTIDQNGDSTGYRPDVNNRELFYDTPDDQGIEDANSPLDREHVPSLETVQPNDLPLRPVEAPPAFAHTSGQKPPVRPVQMSDLRLANSAVDAATLAQLADVNKINNMEGKSVQDGNVGVNGMSVNMPPTQLGPMPKRRGTQPLSRNLPSIPGTPSVEPNGFDLETQTEPMPLLQRGNSSQSITRKPVPERTTQS